MNANCEKVIKIEFHINEVAEKVVKKWFIGTKSWFCPGHTETSKGILHQHFRMNLMEKVL